jgi:hypothetical protein
LNFVLRDFGEEEGTVLPLVHPCQPLFTYYL